MPEIKPKILIVTGGLLTSQEKSLWQVSQKLALQRRNAMTPWLDLRVKLQLAEPLAAMALEKLRPSYLAGVRARKVRQYLKGPDQGETRSLTEVTLATLVHQAGFLYETAEIGEIFSNPGRIRRLLNDCEVVFLSSTYLHDLSELEPLARALKRPGNRLVLGGALTGVIAADWQGLAEIDLVTIGYGELLMDSLTDWIKSGYREPIPPPTGRLLKKEKSLFLFSGVPGTLDLDFLPTPDWGATGRMIYYESVRGCPYRCNFCNYPYLFDDRKFRYKSARRMADEWEIYVKTTGVEYITCLDSLFTMPRLRLTEFCRLLIERDIRVKWICYARADDLLDESLVELLVQAGCHQVQIGVESGDDTLLENMNKSCNVEANRRALLNCRKIGLTTVISLIVGFPGETTASLENTYRFLLESPPDFYFLATFSARVQGIPLLEPEPRKRFGLEVNHNLYSMAPYWKHDSMSCADVIDHVRALDKRLMQNKVSLNATLFFRRLPDFHPDLREDLLEFQFRVATGHPVAKRVFDGLNRRAGRRLREDVESAFGAGE